MSSVEVARRILASHGLYHIPVEAVPGRLSDHYDPISKVVRVSEDVYYDRSIASISVAAHEAGHAVQDKESYRALVLRHRMFPMVNITSGIAPFLLMGVIFLQQTSLIGLGIILFSAALISVLELLKFVMIFFQGTNEEQEDYNIIYSIN